MKLIVSLLMLTFVIHSTSVFAGEGQTDFRWKDVRAACKDNHDSTECHALQEHAREYCQAHPNKKRCRKLHAMKECRNNPNSEKCQEFKERFKAYCEKHPGAKKCVRARVHKICKDDPESEECLSAKQATLDHFCENHPNHEKCSQ